MLSLYFSLEIKCSIISSIDKWDYTKNQTKSDVLVAYKCEFLLIGAGKEDVGNTMSIDGCRKTVRVIEEYLSSFLHTHT